MTALDLESPRDTILHKKFSIQFSPEFIYYVPHVLIFCGTNVAALLSCMSIYATAFLDIPRKFLREIGSFG